MPFLRWVSFLVPTGRRTAWFDEWQGELWEFKRFLEASAYSSKKRRRLINDFLLGAIPHALWERKENLYMNGLVQDIRLAIRGLGKNPGFSLVAVITLALGVASSSAIFTLIDILLLRPPAGVESPEEMIQIGRTYADDPRFDTSSFPNFQIIQAETRALSKVAAYFPTSVILGSGPEAQPVSSQIVSSGYFDALGVTALLGRTFSAANGDIPGSNPGVILSYGAWQNQFGGDPSVIGETIQASGYPLEIIGILPEGFRGVETIANQPGLFLPLSLTQPLLGGLRPEAWESFNRSWLSVFGRLAEGATLESARQDLGRVAGILREAHPNNEGVLLDIGPGLGLDPEEQAEARSVSALLLGVAGFVLLITCANLANLLTARGDSRRREVGIRTALGARKTQLSRLVVTESLMLAMIGGVLALPIATIAIRSLPSLLPWPVTAGFSIDAGVLFFNFAVAALCGLAFGLFPTYRTNRVNPVEAIGNRRAGTRSFGFGQRVLTVMQIALALVLVSGGTSLTRSLILSRSADPGFRTDDLVTARISLGAGTGYEQESGLQFMADRLREFGEIPGVRAVSLSSVTPISPGRPNRSVRREDQLDSEERPFIADVFSIGPDFFSTLEIPLMAGRDLNDAMGAPGAEIEAVVNTAFADGLFPGQDPIGQRFQSGGWFRVVGLAAPVQHRSLREASRPTMYLPLGGQYQQSVDFILATSRDPEEIREAVRAIVGGADPGIPVRSISTGESLVAATMDDTRVLAYLIGAASLLSLILAGVGLHGVVSYRMSRRIREFGIRMAVGASGSRVVGEELRRALVLVLPGVLLGLGLSLALGQVLSSLLYGVVPWSISTNLVNLVVIGGAAMLASLGPARRSASVDLVDVLRTD